MELWTVDQCAEYWNVKASRARMILSTRRIRRVSGYPVDQVKAVELRQGARNDLNRPNPLGPPPLLPRVAHALALTQRPERQTQAWSRAVHRMLSEAEPGPLFDGPPADALPTDFRTARIYGPIGAGKTLCARRHVRQALSAGRHVIVICPRPHVGEYAFQDIAADSLSLIDTDDFRDEWDSEPVLNTIDKARRAALPGPLTVVVDAAPLYLPSRFNLVRELAKLFVRLDSQDQFVFVTAYLDSPDHDGLFDVEVVLPGRAHEDGYRSGIHHEDLPLVAAPLSEDDLRRARLAARIGGGGIATSSVEDAVLDALPYKSVEWEYLVDRRSRVLEPPAPTVDCEGTPGVKLAHGVLRDRNSVVTQFNLPDLTKNPL